MVWLSNPRRECGINDGWIAIFSWWNALCSLIFYQHLFALSIIAIPIVAGVVSSMGLIL